jgi:MerR family copper efflux transcriptional regulator
MVDQLCADVLVSLEAQPAPSHNGKVNRENDEGNQVNISEAAERSGVSAKMIRYYEGVGLIEPADRRANGYRDYGEHDIAMLQFVRRTRDLGFSLEEVAALLALWRDRSRSSRAVRKLAEQHLADIEARIAEMRAVSRTLKRLVHACHGDDRPDCPILNDLARPGRRRASARP